MKNSRSGPEETKADIDVRGLCSRSHQQEVEELMTIILTMSILPLQLAFTLILKHAPVLENIQVVSRSPAHCKLIKIKAFHEYDNLIRSSDRSLLMGWWQWGRRASH